MYGGLNEAVACVQPFALRVLVRLGARFTEEVERAAAIFFLAGALRATLAFVLLTRTVERAATVRVVVLRLAAGETPGPETSVDKLHLGQTEQLVLDTVRTLRGPAFELDDSDEAEQWRVDWFYTRAATIYGGAAEVQRDITAATLRL